MEGSRSKLTADLDGGFKLQEVGLAEEDLAGDGAELLDLRLREPDQRAGPRRPHLQQPADDAIKHFRVHQIDHGRSIKNKTSS